MALLAIFIALLLLIASIYLFLRIWFKQNTERLRQQYTQQGLPFAHVPNVMVQAYWGLRPELIEDEAIKKNGKVFGTDLFGTKTIFVAEPALIQLILSKEFTSFTNRRKFEFDDPIFSSFLSVVSDEKWKRIRSVVTPTFSAGKLKLMKPRIDDSVATLMQNIEKRCQSSSIINFKELYGAYTMDAIMQVAFGIKSDSLSDPNNQIVSTAKALFSRDINLPAMLFLSIMFTFPKLLAQIAKVIKLNQDLIKFFKDFSLKIIAEKRAKLESETGNSNSGKANNFLEMLLEAEKEYEALNSNDNNNDDSAEMKKTVKFMNNNEIIAQCVLFFLAAYDTTTTTKSLATYLLAQNESIQERLYEELDQYLVKLKSQSHDGTDPLSLITFESLSQLEYLNAVVSETLRLYPPVPTERTASRDIVLETEDGQHRLVLKKDDIVRFPVYTIHRDAEQFPDPDAFNPNRFLGENGGTHHRYAYLPFGAGPRNCVARSLALYEAKMALLNVFSQYRITTCSKTANPLKFYNNGQILTPRDIHLQVVRR